MWSCLGHYVIEAEYFELTLAPVSIFPYYPPSATCISETYTSSGAHQFMAENRTTQRGLNILCLDGGGVRGLSCLLLLEEVMKRIQKLEETDTMPQPHDYFDVIAGTGTGAVQACMLGRLKIPLQSATKTYVKLVKDVFSEKKWIGSGAFKMTKLKEAVKGIVRGVTGSEEDLLRQPVDDQCKTIIFAMSKHNMNASIPTMFRSYHAFANEEPNCTIWEALCATMAHPDLFKGFVIDGPLLKRSFVDAGLGCNNPLEHVLAEVKQVYPGRQVASIVSIGAGHTRTIQIPDPSLLRRFLPTNVIVAMKDIATDSEGVAQRMSARFSRTHNVYFRLNIDQGVQNVELNEWESLDEVAAHTHAYTRGVDVNQRMDAVARAVKERKAMVTTGQIDGGVQGVMSARETVVKRCPAPTPVFTGREDKTRKIESYLLGSGLERRLCVIHGLGGAGKTQIALKVIENTFDKWSEVIYIDASSRESIENTLRAFAVSKKIGETHEDTIVWLESQRKPWLLVFDSADDPSFSLRGYFPNRNHGSILLTTRQSGLVSLGQDPNCDCNVSGMKETESLALLLKTARIQGGSLSTEDLASAKELLKDFGHLAFAVVHAGAFLQHSPHMSISKYRREFLTRRQRILDSYGKLPPSMRIDDYTRTVYTTWLMCYDLLGPHARALLWLIAHLHNDGITVQIFRRAAVHITSYRPDFPPTELEVTACKATHQLLGHYLDSDQSWDSLAFSSTIGEISSRSLLEYDSVNQAYKIHPLVQDWVHTIIPHAPDLALECARILVSLSVDGSASIESVHFRIKLLLHVKKLSAQLDTLNPNYMSSFSDVYSENGDWKALGLLRSSIAELSREVYGEEHPATLMNMNKLATTYLSQGRWDEAEVLVTRVLDVRNRVLGEEHPDTLISMGDLATTYWNQGRSGEAETLEMQVLDVRKRVLGEEHPDTLRSMGNLAATYLNQGRWAEAEALEVQVLDVQKRVLGEEHPATLTTMNNLAVTYSSQGRWDEAGDLEVRAVDIRTQVLGEEHPDTLRSVSNIAVTYWRQGRWTRAEAFATQALEIQKRALGAEHPDTLINTNILAMIYVNQGRLAEAEALQGQILDAQKRVVGEEHPDTLRCISNLAMTYLHQGRWGEAEALGMQVLGVRKRVLGEEHPDTLATMGDLVATYLSQGQWAKAEALEVQVLDARKRILGEEHPDTLTSANDLALAYWNQGQWDKAEALGMQVLGARKRVLGEEHPNTLRSIENLAMTYLHQGRWGEAEALEVQVLGIRKRVLGEEHPDTLLAMYNLAVAYSDRNRLAEAEILEVQVLDVRKRVLGEEHPDTLRSIENLAVTHLKQGRWSKAEALEVQLNVLDIRKRVLGEEHPDTLMSRYNLAVTYRNQGRWDEAAEVQAPAVDVLRRRFGKQHPDTLEAEAALKAILDEISKR